MQDIALLRAADCEILSTNRGYICSSPQKCMRIIQVYHTDERIEEELHAIVDCGGTVEDVFVQHEVYGELRAVLNISSRRQVKQFWKTFGRENPNRLRISLPGITVILSVQTVKKFWI